MNERVSHRLREHFVYELLRWYDTNKRDLPWRKSGDPYQIWVSEIMLQQTRVETVIPYFERFMERFPTLDALAEAEEDEVLKYWEGLGYYSRARNLHAAVREVKERYHSRVPDNLKDILSLKGVGPYTAGAVLSIAYGLAVPAVDGNVMRVLSRYFLIEDDITRPGTRTLMEEILRETIPVGRAGDFNQALMEHGALVCTPRSPQCGTCSVRTYCRAREHGMEQVLPVKKKAKPPKLVQRVVALVEGTGEHEGRFLIRRRPDDGLLAKMWELPHFESVEELPLDVRLRRGLLEEDGIEAIPGRWLMDAEHTFSHLHWEMKVYQCRGRAVSPSGSDPAYRWITADDMDQYAFPNVFLKIIRSIVKEKEIRA